jgi:enediyne biosynthesis protein E4
VLQVLQSYLNPMMNLSNRLILSMLIGLMAPGCERPAGNVPSDTDFKTQFVEKDPRKSGFDFSNILDEERLVNPFSYINAYNGGGVAIGDLNNDGLQDVYMTGNMVSSGLFMNRGNFTFEDVTERAGVRTRGWCSGVTMADVNNDGWLDIYVCRTYYDIPEDRANLLFINNQDGTFSEKAGQLGINDENFSVSASFFDYDRDGDPDLVVANHPRDRAVSLTVHYNYWISPVKKFSNRFFRNDGGSFTEVTESAGLLSYGFSLGVTTSDLDSDGWPDIYIPVDHDEPDLVFHNNGDGTFTNIFKTALKQNSRSSMGIDAGDVNHDLYPDMLVVEMLSEDPFREKVFMNKQSVERFQFLVDSLQYKYYQMRNYLHLNNGNNTFSDIGQLAGVHRTDWSWAALFMDADNDSWQDIFISNGYYRDVYNNDLFQPFDAQMMALTDMAEKNRVAAGYARNCPHLKMPNYLFRNTGRLVFENRTAAAGLARSVISTGAAYGDLDNDGDLDLIVSNIGEPSSLYENKTPGSNKYLRCKLAHDTRMAGLGTKVILEYNGTIQSREFLTTRGFQSSCEPIAHFGMGDVDVVEKVRVIWPDGKMQTLADVPTNQTLSVEYQNANEIYTPPAKVQLVQELPVSETGLDFVQQENYYNDYEDQVLLPHKMSEQGPFIAAGDVNGDQLEDLYFGAPTGQAGVLFVQNGAGGFAKAHIQDFENDKFYEDAHSAFFDADGDGDADLLVASGGYEFPENAPRYQPRLYLNDGKGGFAKAAGALPSWPHSSSCVKPADYDGDGDTDVFIGGILTPQKYPEPGRSGLFINDGKGQFAEHLENISPEIARAGMVKDALWTDINQDKKPDLIVVGEWMPVTFWIQEHGKLINKTEEVLPNSPGGWWNCIAAADLDGNGLEDYVIGNLGLNYKYKASERKPFTIYGKDFDNNGSYDIVLGAYYGDMVYPVRGRTCSAQQMPDIEKKYPTFADYAKADLNQVYGEDLEGALHYNVTRFTSIILYQDKPGGFSISELPVECQIAPANSIVVTDVNKDGKQDLILAGNFYQSEIETGRVDAGTGKILLNMGRRDWKPLRVYESGLYISNDVKSMKLIRLGKSKRPVLIVGNNKAACQVVELLEEAL